MKQSEILFQVADGLGSKWLTTSMGYFISAQGNRELALWDYLIEFEDWLKKQYPLIVRIEDLQDVQENKFMFCEFLAYSLQDEGN